MTKDEQVVIDVLEHNAKQWDATDPVQAQSFRDAARLLAQLAAGADLATARGPEDTPTPEPFSEDPVLAFVPAPPVSTDPADAPVIPPTNPDTETPANG